MTGKVVLLSGKRKILKVVFFKAPVNDLEQSRLFKTGVHEDNFVKHRVGSVCAPGFSRSVTGLWQLTGITSFSLTLIVLHVQEFGARTFSLGRRSPSVLTALAVLQWVLWRRCLTSLREHKTRIKGLHFRFHTCKLQVHTGKCFLAAAKAELWVRPSKKPHTPALLGAGLGCACHGFVVKLSPLPAPSLSWTVSKWVSASELGSWECLITRNYLCWGFF